MNVEEMKALLDRELPDFIAACRLVLRTNKHFVVLNSNDFDTSNDLVANTAIRYAAKLGLSITFSPREFSNDKSTVMVDGESVLTPQFTL